MLTWLLLETVRKYQKLCIQLGSVQDSGDYMPLDYHIQASHYKLIDTAGLYTNVTLIGENGYLSQVDIYLSKWSFLKFISFTGILLKHNMQIEFYMMTLVIMECQVIFDLSFQFCAIESLNVQRPCAPYAFTCDFSYLKNPLWNCKFILFTTNDIRHGYWKLFPISYVIYFIY